MPQKYKYESILKTFQYSKESYQIISDFLLSGDITNPDILLNVTKISKEFGKEPKHWFQRPSTKEMILALIEIQCDEQQKKLKTTILKFLKEEKITKVSEEKLCKNSEFMDFMKQELYQLTVKLAKKLNIIVVKRGNTELTNSLSGTWLHRDLIEEYLKWLANGKDKNQPDGLYLIKTGEFIKIGISQNIEKRIKSMETDNPHKIELLFYQKIENARKIESFLHKQLKEHNVKNEWFKLNKRAINKIIQNMNSFEKLQENF
jgi:hypothetical protein